ncbi:MAG: MFS transporter [Clostridiales bacterium]|nr:MFS transporter [Candidatus Blautia equi]
MAQTRSLPDKYYGENGVHRVPLWRVAGFALNNTATNTYLFLMNFVAYYLTGFVGVSVVTASSFAMMMRIWDGVTDPFIGFTVDKTNGKFGKNRPFMVIGQLILLVMSYIMFHFTPSVPEAARYPFFIVCAAIYYIGYTFQCVVTKSAQTCLTNDPKQRPLFTMFDGAYNTLLFAFMPVVATKIATSNEGGFVSQVTWNKLWILTASISLVFTIIAVISIAPKDRSEFFGTGQAVKVGLKDYWDTIKGNRAIQMLIVSASSDKLASSMRTSTIYIVLFGLIAGNYSIYGTMTGMTSIPSAIICMVFVGGLATTLGQRKAMLIGSWGGIVLNAVMICLWIFGDPTSMSSGYGTPMVWSFFTVAYIVLTVAIAGFQGISGNIVIPMTADCADYEVYRTGKYVPGLMGTLFSLVDKLISSFAPMITGVMLAGIGFTTKLPDADTTMAMMNDGITEGFQGINVGAIMPVALFLAFGTVIIGLLCNIVALKFYPLTKEYMAEIQDEIAAIKAKAMNK